MEIPFIYITMLAGFVSGFACGIITMAYYFKYKIKKLAKEDE